MAALLFVSHCCIVIVAGRVLHEYRTAASLKSPALSTALVFSRTSSLSRVTLQFMPSCAPFVAAVALFIDSVVAIDVMDELHPNAGRPSGARVNGIARGFRST